MRRLIRSVGRVVAWSLGVCGFLYVRLCYATSRFHLTKQSQDSLRETLGRDVPVVFVCWHDEFILSLVIMQLDWFRRSLFITNDSFGGKFLESCCRCLGLPIRVIRRKDPRDGRILAMAAGLEAHRSLAIAADYGQPWYKARPTAFQLAKMTNGCVVPMRVEPKPALRLRLGDRHAFFPLPFSRFALVAGQPRWASEKHDPTPDLSTDLDRLRDSSAFKETRSVTN